jgi:serine phosphatase RsbU (regulator of sigma subunit)
MLPDDAVLESILPRHFIFWVPRDIVSGDYYWVRSFGDRVVIMVADCTGHGVPGAFMSLLGMSFLNELVSEMSDMMPHLILEEMRRSLKESLHQTQTGERPRDGMDAALCVWDRRKMKAYFSGAKNPLFLLREGHLHSFKGSICPIGFHPKETGFETEIVDLEPGDWLYMFSDGFKDQFGGPRQKKINAKGFKDQLLRMYEEEVPITQQGEQLAQFFHEWKGEGRQIDDVLVFGFEAVPKSDSA